MSYAREIKALNAQITIVPFAFATTGTTVTVKSAFGNARKFKVIAIVPNTHGMTPNTDTLFFVSTTAGCDAFGFYTPNADGSFVVNRLAGTDSGLTGTVTLATI